MGAITGHSEVTQEVIASVYKYTGKERDSESGLDNLGARYYGGNMGRMMSPDPVAGSAWNPQSLNAYSYVWNNPLKLTDPTGRVVSWEDSKASCKKGETTCKTNLQWSYEKRIQSLLNSKNAKDVAKGQKLQATYQKLQDAREVFQSIRKSKSRVASDLVSDERKFLSLPGRKICRIHLRKLGAALPNQCAGTLAHAPAA